MQSSWGVSRVFFESVTLGSFVAMVVLGLIFWGIGARRRRTGELGTAIPAAMLSADPTPSADGT